MATVRRPSSVAAPHDADGDFTAIGNEEFLHGPAINSNAELGLSLYSGRGRGRGCILRQIVLYLGTPRTLSPPLSLSTGRGSKTAAVLWGDALLLQVA